MALIRSILEQDLYKFNMCANILHHCPGVEVEFRFNNRRPEGKFTEAFARGLQLEIDAMAGLQATDEEIDFLRRSCPSLAPHFLEFVRNYRYDPSQVEWEVVEGELEWKCVGPWESVTMWEVPMMALISELYFQHCETAWNTVGWQQAYESRTAAKAKILEKCALAEFGLRRRCSYEVQDLVVKTLMEHHPKFIGVSNVHMAHKYNIKPIGTMAHELFMGYSVLRGLRHANRYVLEDWSQTFQGDLGVALTDTFGSDAFLQNFGGYLARLFDGVRHDSGDPFAFGDKVIEHYKRLHIDPKTKTIVFSDGLSPELAVAIQDYFAGKIRVAFGIGTNLTNDFPECSALNMVIKMWSCDGVPVVKLSDVAAKQIGDSDALRVARWTFFGEPLG